MSVLKLVNHDDCKK